MIAALAPLALQGAALAIDEFYLHHKRGLGRWERMGHPVDTFSFGACSLLALFSIGHTADHLTLFVILSALSCLIVTKDEFVHRLECSAFENWLHAVLFILHPVSLYCLWSLAESGASEFLIPLNIGIGGFFLYQLVYWNFFKSKNLKKA